MSTARQTIQEMIRNLGGTVSDFRPRVSRRRRRKATRGSQRTLKRRTVDALDNYLNLKDFMNSENDNKIFLGVSDFDDLITTELLKRRVDAGKQTVHRETTVLANRQKWSVWAGETFKGDLYVQGNSSSGFFIY